MEKRKYELTQEGINAMENDSLDFIFAELEKEGGTVADLDFHVTIGDMELVIPSYAEAFELLFDSLKKIEKEVEW